MSFARSPSDGNPPFVGTASGPAASRDVRPIEGAVAAQHGSPTSRVIASKDMPTRDRDRDEPSRRASRERHTETPATAQVEIDDAAVLTALAGPRNEHLRTLESEVGVAIVMRGNQIHLQGSAVDVAFVERVIAELVQSLRDGNALTQPDVARAVRLLRDHPEVKLRDVFHDVVLVSARHRVIAPMNDALNNFTPSSSIISRPRASTVGSVCSTPPPGRKK